MSRSGLSTITVVDALVNALRAQILDGEWPPGASVAEVEVARRFQVSRPTAKAAVRTLEFEGLLRHDSHHAAVVPSLSARDIEDLYFVRIPLELAMVERLAQLDAARLDDAENAIGALERLPDDAVTSSFVAADLGFHRALAAATGSWRLERSYNALAGEVHLCMIQTRQALGRTRIVREHRRILQAIRRGDGAEAVEATRRHLAGARDALLTIADGTT
jgi:DNA-binding GntR family transcriptional regulator